MEKGLEEEEDLDEEGHGVVVLEEGDLEESGLGVDPEEEDLAEDPEEEGLAEEPEGEGLEEKHFEEAGLAEGGHGHDEGMEPSCCAGAAAQSPL